MATGGGINQISIPILLQFITLVAPYFLASFFVLLSIINGDIKGFMYLFGVFIVIEPAITILAKIIKNIKIPKEKNIINFGVLLNLVSASNADNEEVLWKFIQNKKP